MKLEYYFASPFLLLLGNGVGLCNGFAPPAMMKGASSVAVFMQDTSEAVKAATEASEKFGKASPEARMAWEVVEEMDAANSYEKTREKDMAKRQAEIERLQKQVAEKVPVAPTVHVDTTDAVKDALETSKMFGKDSVEARLAWDIVEELDTANSHHRGEDIHVYKEKIEAAEPVVEDKPAAAVPQTVNDAINAAMLASKLYGTHSTEARTAWELVEEMDAAVGHQKADEQAVKAEAAAAAAAEAAAAKEEEKPKQRSVHMDTSEAIKAALEASKTHGKTSVEARMAWEVVEEIDAANAHFKTVGSG